MIELEAGERIAVIGFDYRQALHWARWESGLPLDRVIVVGDPRHIMGVSRGLRFVLLDGFYDRRNWREFSDSLRSRGARQIVW